MSGPASTTTFLATFRIDEHGFAEIALVGRRIGRAAELLMASRGATLVCLDRDGKSAEETSADIRSKGGAASSYTIEVTDAVSQPPVWDDLFSKSGQLHALVNCAGVTGKTNIKAHEVDPEDFIDVVRVNMLGALLVSKAVLPHMLSKGYGRILHVASIAGKDGNAGMTAYSASKAGLIGMVKSMGKDYAETGVTINSLAPAVIRTPLVDAMPDAQVKYMTDKIPMRRCGELSEAAELIAWIVSPACSFTTGFTFDLSGGRATY